MKPGEHRLRDAIRRIRDARPFRPKDRVTFTIDSERWAVEVNQRLHSLETRQKWLIALSITTLAVVLKVSPESLATLLKGITTLP
jgi:AraC-like DNA-binding protein